MKEILSVKDLCKTYIVNSNSTNVLRNINFTMYEGEFVSVMGASGSGKSTLLYTVSGMDSVTSGSVIFNDHNLSEMKRKELSSVRLREMGFLFQQMYMMNRLCIFDNIVLPGYQAGKRTRKQVNEYAEELMRNLNIMDIAEHNINEVSGGQLQRACLCRSLINNPVMLFADEPTGSLNSKAAEEVMAEILKANSNGTSVLMVTHSTRVAAMSDRVIYISDGDIRGEYSLGKTSDDRELSSREKQLANWLMNQGW